MTKPLDIDQQLIDLSRNWGCGAKANAYWHAHWPPSLTPMQLWRNYRKGLLRSAILASVQSFARFRNLIHQRKYVVFCIERIYLIYLTCHNLKTTTGLHPRCIKALKTHRVRRASITLLKLKAYHVSVTPSKESTRQSLSTWWWITQLIVTIINQRGIRS